MTNNVLDQLQRYGEDFAESVDAISFDEVAPRRIGPGPVRPLRLDSPARRWTPAATLAAAAVVVVLVLGAVAVLLARPPAIAPSEPAPTTTAPPTTVADAADVTEFTEGMITWQRVSGGPLELPPSYAVKAAGESGFVAFEGAYRFTSSDAVTWTVAELGTPEGADFVYPVEVAGKMWMVDPVQGVEDATSGIYRLIDGQWTSVGPEMELPNIEGLAWTSPDFRNLAGVGDVVIVKTVSFAVVPWGQLYGTFENPQLQDGASRLEPSGWLVDDRQFIVLHPVTGEELAHLDVELQSTTPLEVVFTDASTGAEVHRVTGDIPGTTEASVLESLANVFFTSLASDFAWWVSIDGSSFEPMTVPWDADVDDAVAGVIEDTLYVRTRSFDAPHEVAVWSTIDGASWRLVARPDFGLSASEDALVDISKRGDRLVARVTRFEKDLESVELWESATGEEWFLLGAPPTPDANIAHTSIGWVAVDFSGVYLSEDFVQWDLVGNAPATELEMEEILDGSGWTSAHVVGDLIIYSVGSDQGDRVMWIGRFTG